MDMKRQFGQFSFAFIRPSLYKMKEVDPYAKASVTLCTYKVKILAVNLLFFASKRLVAITTIRKGMVCG